MNRKIFLFIGVIFLFSSYKIISQAGWYQQNSGVNIDLSNILIWNYFVAGDNGMILKTSDGGFSWISQYSGYNEKLNYLTSFGNQNYFIVGNNGLILKSKNSGNNWIKINSGTNFNLNVISNVSQGNRLYIMGENGLLLYSTNTGDTWTPQSSGTSNNLNSALNTASNGLTVVGDNGTIIKTTNNGLNWLNINSGTLSNLNHIWIGGYSLESFVTVGDNGIIIFSSDGGFTWSLKNSGTNVNLNSSYSDYFSFNQKLNHVIVGDGGLIIRSTDFGNTWISENSTTSNNLNFISGYDEHMYISGNNGTILNYTLGYGYYSNLFVDANNIKAYHYNNGLFNYRGYPYYGGLVWPKSTNLMAVFNAGLWLTAKIDDSIRVALSYYENEYYPGAIDYYNQIPVWKNNPQYRIYKISPVYPNGGNGFDSWVDWPVIQGAKWVDLNNNGIYDPPTDRPVMKGDQNTFCCFTDGYPESHLHGSGSTGPLNSEIHMYTYASVNQQCADIQFMEWEIINKNNQNWDSLMIALWSDTDLGYASDDVIGCDSALNMAFCYNKDNDDEGYYGIAPPAIGYVIYDVSRHNSQFADFINDPRKNSNEPEIYYQVFNLLKGFKKDGSHWINPVTNKFTKYPLSGDPETGTGWIDNWSGDRRLLFGSYIGSVVPLDTIKFKAAVIIKRGTNNLNSVTQLKNCINQGVIGLKEQHSSTIIPKSYKLFQNFPNPFNPKTKIKFEMPEKASITLIIYNIQGRVIANLLDNKLTESGYHEIEFDGTNYASGIYFYNLFNSKFSKTHKMVLLK